MRKDPMDEVRKTLAQMKANGVTISYTPGPDSTSPGERAMGVLHEEAKKLGMTFGHDEPEGTP
jgi:hypothetical protein